MNRPCLIAATPRAGRWNHRFLVPPSASLEEADVARWADQARRSSIGRDYLAVVREDVAQTDGGRRGEEMLIVAGLETAMISERDQIRLRHKLSGRLDDLAQLVLHGVDWEREGRRMLVPRGELHDWYHQDVVPALFTAPATSSPKKKRVGPMLALAVMVVAAAALVLGMTGGLPEWLRKFLDSGKPNVTTTATQEEKQGVSPFEVNVTRWAKALGIEAGNHPQSSLVGQVADKLEEQLFLDDNSPEPDPDSALAENTLAEDQARLQRRLGTLYKAAALAPEKEELQVLLQDERLLKIVEDLMAEQPDRFVFVQEHQDILEDLVPSGTREEIKDFRQLLIQAETLARQYASERNVLDASEDDFHDLLVRGRWDEHRTGLTIDKSLTGLGVLTQADAQAAVTLLNCLVTPKQDAHFASFPEWHKAVKGEYLSLITAVAPYHKSRGETESERTFAELLEHLNLILQKPGDRARPEG